MNMSDLKRLLAELISKRDGLELVNKADDGTLSDEECAKFADFLHNLMYAVPEVAAPQVAPDPEQEPEQGA